MHRGLYLLIFMVSCDFYTNKDECSLVAGRYEVQDVTYSRDLDQYELILFGNLGCEKNPVVMNTLLLAKLEDKESTAAQLDYTNPISPVLNIKQEFKIKILESPKDASASSGRPERAPPAAHRRPRPRL